MFSYFRACLSLLFIMFPQEYNRRDHTSVTIALTISLWPEIHDTKMTDVSHTVRKELF